MGCVEEGQAGTDLDASEALQTITAQVEDQKILRQAFRYPNKVVQCCVNRTDLSDVCWGTRTKCFVDLSAKTTVVVLELAL